MHTDKDRVEFRELFGFRHAPGLAALAAGAPPLGSDHGSSDIARPSFEIVQRGHRGGMQAFAILKSR